MPINLPAFLTHAPILVVDESFGRELKSIFFNLLSQEKGRYLKTPFLFGFED